MTIILNAALAVSFVCALLWLFKGRHAVGWQPSAPDPAALDTPEAVALVQRLAIEAQMGSQADEVVRLMGWLFSELPPAELRALVQQQGRDWLAVTQARLSPATGAIVVAALADTAAAAEARDFAAGREHMLTLMNAVRELAFAHPGAALLAAGMNGAWARERFGPAAG